MKKSSKMIMMTLLASLAIGGCTPKNSSLAGTSSTPAPTSSPTTSSPDTSSPEVKKETITSISWGGIKDTTVSHKKIFGALAGVKIVATVEGTKEVVVSAMLLEISAEGATLTNNTVDTTTLSVGDTFTVTYKISDAIGNYVYADGVSNSKTITVTVTEEADNLVINGDFEDGTTGWGTEGVPTYGELTVEADGSNHYAKLNVTADSGTSYQPRINTEFSKAGYGLRFEPNTSYQLTYKAKADNARNIFVQLGKLLTADPWFNLYVNKVQPITTEWQEYTMTFTYTGAATETDAHVVFECGKVDGVYTAGGVYFDDVSVAVFTGELPDETAPVIEGAGYLRVDIGGTVNLMNGILATDDKDGDITSKVTYTIADYDTGATVTEIDTSKAGKYKVTYRVSDEAGHEATAVRTVRVCDPSEPDENAFTAPTSIKNGAEGDAALNPGVLYEWHDQAWCGSTVTVNEFSWTNSQLIYDYSVEGNPPFYAAQLFYAAPDMLDGRNFTLTLKVNSSVAGNITINGKVCTLAVGDNNVSVTAPVTSANGVTSFNVQFGDNGAQTFIGAGRFVFSNFEAYAA